MIAKDDVIMWLQNPMSLTDVSLDDLKELKSLFPFCEMLHWLYIRKLYISEDVHLEQEMRNNAMCISNRPALYSYLHETEAIESGIPVINDLTPAVGDYFPMNSNESYKQTLQELAARLKAARLARRQQQSDKELDSKVAVNNSNANALQNGAENIQSSSVEIESKTSQKEEKNVKPDVDILSKAKTVADDTAVSSDSLDDEHLVVKLIKEKKYLDALQILKAINLNNPKKSVYFALQIKYLETIISNNK